MSCGVCAPKGKPCCASCCDCNAFGYEEALSSLLTAEQREALTWVRELVDEHQQQYREPARLLEVVDHLLQRTAP